jgi:hypothetical protein
LSPLEEVVSNAWRGPNANPSQAGGTADRAELEWMLEMA